jgi:uncharacterized protein YodC (DUF2158 family)
VAGQALPEREKDMAGSTFKVGDVVKLKSGGPKMTVAGPAVSKIAGYISCSWFDKDGNHIYKDLKEGTLEKDDGSSGNQP